MTRVALLTGGTDGIGKAAAAVLLHQGWRVVLTGRNPQKCAATVAELQQTVPGAAVSALCGDLQVMADVARIADEFRSQHQHLDALILNANTITQTYERTAEGFERNFAVGYLGRALLALRLRDLLERTPGSRVISVVGLNLAPFDTTQAPTEQGFSSMKVLGQWQWAVQLFAREWARRVSQVGMATWMPGLVRTKILANEPQPMRIFVQIAQWIVGIPVEKSGRELAAAIEMVRNAAPGAAYVARTKDKGVRPLPEQPDDDAKLWQSTELALAPWLASSAA